MQIGLAGDDKENASVCGKIMLQYSSRCLIGKVGELCFVLLCALEATAGAS